MEIVHWIQNNWVQITAALWSLDQLLKIIAKLTPTQIDDNISDYIGSILAKFLPNQAK